MEKELIINKDNLRDEEVNKTNFKSRLIIINDNDEILLQNYAGLYMLPGGKENANETPIIGLTREIKEETGINIDSNEITPLMVTKMYVRNYPNSDGKENVNSLSTTNYFYIRSNKNVSKDEVNLTDSEKENNLTMKFVHINEILNLIKNNPSSNPRKKYFDEELLRVLDEYNKKRIVRANENLIDMHIHTLYSDGDFEPSEIVKRVKEAGISTFSITDHDTILGCKQLEGFKEPGLTFIPGVELSAAVPKGRMHILGYNIDIPNQSHTELLDKKRSNSVRSIELMYQYIHRAYGVDIPQYEFDALYNKIGDIGRPDLASLIRKYGYADTIDDAFKKYLIEAFDATRINRITTSKEDCMRALKDACAYVSLAHPVSLKMEYEELKWELKYLKSLGLDAIEICHSNQSEEYRDFLRDLKDELNLYETAGSDYHGPTVKPDVELGTGRNNNIKVKQLSLIDKIKS